MKALTKDRDQRYGSVLEFAHAFAEATHAPKAVVGAVREPPLRDHDTILQSAAPPTTRHPISGKTGTGATKSRLPLWVGVPAASLLLVLAGWYLASAIHPRGGSPTQPATAKTPPATVSTAVPPTVTEWDASGNPLLVVKDGLKYVWIPPGTFMMGCSPGDNECYDYEKPPHQVTITKGFWLGQTEVTVGAYKRFAAATGRQMPDTPGFNSRWTNENMPIVNVTWNDAHDYCAWAGGRLPTEAEWEYAARGGSTEARYGPIDDVAWYDGNSGGQTHDVAQKRPNASGLYDMLGNVWEWVKDWDDENNYDDITQIYAANKQQSEITKADQDLQRLAHPPGAPGPSQDPAGPPSGTLHVLRGGSWDVSPRDVRVSYRGGDNPAYMYNYIGIGFRCGGEVFAP